MLYCVHVRKKACYINVIFIVKQVRFAGFFKRKKLSFKSIKFINNILEV